jgi:bifunctional DNase/RNase
MAKNMDEKKECSILGISQTQTLDDNYLVVLEEEGTDRKLPVVVREREAQYIALKLEGITGKRILLWDFIESLGSVHQFSIDQIWIHSVHEGVFYTKVLTVSNLGSGSVSNREGFELNISVGDALCLACTYGCPILVSSHILDTYGISLDSEGNPVGDSPNVAKSGPKVTLENLQKMLDKAIEEEDYEIASQIRDKIKSMKGELE